MSGAPPTMSYARLTTPHDPWWLAWTDRGAVASAEGEWPEDRFRAFARSRTGAEPVAADPALAPSAVDWDALPGGFRGEVLRACAAIPRGRVMTYGELAAAAGRPGAARAAGTAMATNPLPLLVPCHRVVRGDGRIGEYGAGGTARKAAMLRTEGVALSGDRVLA